MKTILTLIGAVVLAGCTAGESPKVTKPSPDKEGLTWTLADMVSHLKVNGVYTKTSGSAERRGRPGEYFWAQDMRDEQDHLWGIYQHSTIKEARDTAGAQGGYAWGRFVFRTDTEGIAQIKKALAAN